MTLRKLALSATAAAVSALALGATASAAPTVITVGEFTPFAQFYLTGTSTPTSPVITANFGATIDGSDTAFDDQFVFTIPQTGTGSASLSTSFAGTKAELDITSVTLDGTSVPLSAADSAVVNGYPIKDGVQNVFEVIGHTVAGARSATYSGTATFVASATPEPASWLLMIGGLGFLGMMMRRRSDAAHFA